MKIKNDDWVSVKVRDRLKDKWDCLGGALSFDLVATWRDEHIPKRPCKSYHNRLDFELGPWRKRVNKASKEKCNDDSHKLKQTK